MRSRVWCSLHFGSVVQREFDKDIVRPFDSLSDFNSYSALFRVRRVHKGEIGNVIQAVNNPLAYATNQSARTKDRPIVERLSAINTDDFYGPQIISAAASRERGVPTDVQSGGGPPPTQIHCRTYFLAYPREGDCEPPELDKQYGIQTLRGANA